MARTSTRSRALQATGILAALSWSAGGGCSSTSSRQVVEQTCRAGEQASCVCDAGGVGTQTCRADAGFEPCICAAGGAGGTDAGAMGRGGSGGAGARGGSSGASGSGGSGTLGSAGAAGSAGASGSGGGTGTLELGARCTSDAQCGRLSCIRENTVNGVVVQVPQGTCSRSCTSSAECAEHGGDCYKGGGGATATGFCVERCSFGSESSAFSPDKCHGRPEFACGPFAANAAPLCVPWCNADADCGTGAHCNLRNGTCGASPFPGSPTGDPCVSGTTNTCRGLCGNVNDETGRFTSVCADLCTLGSPRACGGATAPASAACAIVDPRIANPGTGDAAHCIELCDCTRQCHNTDLECVTDGTGDVLGRKGFCHYVLPGLTEVSDCD